ncbi:hypothetical protein U879_01545, partial [Defluviimonas sp. 20V17]
LGRMRDAAGRVLDGAEAPPPAGAADAPAAAGPAVLAARDLSYRREGAARAVLNGLSLELAPGETLAVAGPSGVGKSTLLFLCAGLLQPSDGDITLAGRALADWDEPALRARLTLVPQRAALVAGTIRDNLALATATLDDSAAWAVLGAVALDAVVAARGGLESRLGEGGAGLSGGEARRLVLARALLRRPEVLLLDEPTEGLDPETAAAVLRGLRATLPRAAILTASHRAAELAWADRVITLG